MSFYEEVKPKLLELEGELREKWYVCPNQGNKFLKFENFQFTLDGEFRAKFSVYDYWKGIDPVEVKSFSLYDTYQLVEVEQEYVDTHLAQVAQIHLLKAGENEN